MVLNEITVKSWLGIASGALAIMVTVWGIGAVYHGKFYLVQAAQVQQEAQDNVLNQIRLDGVKTELRRLKIEKAKEADPKIKALLQADIDELDKKQGCIEAGHKTC